MTARPCAVRLEIVTRSRTAALLSALALVLSACSGATAAPPPAPAAKKEAVLRQSQDEITRTAGSLRKLDDLPLYEMTYHGGYDAEAPLTDAELARKADGWACSLFHRKGEFGRNFDWHPNPAMIVHADPPDGYSSLSVVDVAYLLDREGPPDLASPADRRRLAHAVIAPFDGVNEKGLAVGMAAVPTATLPATLPGRPVVSGERIIRLMLDRAATVDEAIALMRTYNVDFTGGPQIHYLIADRSGKSAVVEYTAGKLNVIEDHLLTNFTMTGSSKERRLDDTRYRTLAEGVGTSADGITLLSRVAQGHTRWSVVYNLDDGSAKLVTRKRWTQVHTVGLKAGQPVG